MNVKKLRRTTITGRWLINSVGVVFIVLSGVVLSASIFLKSYYYSSARQYLYSRMNMLSSDLESSYNPNTRSFSDSFRNAVENWPGKNTIELMIISKDGTVEISSSGFKPSVGAVMEDYSALLESEGGNGYFEGRLDATDEKVMALSAALPPNDSDYGAIRMVTSVEGLDAHIRSVTLTMAVIGSAILLFMFFSGLYFVKSIVIPVKRIGTIAQRYALGDFSTRIEKDSDDEIGGLCDAINYMAGELAAADDMKNEFISSVSHELRTPLTAIKGWAETIESMPDDRNAITRGMRVIGSETERLSQMVEELLDFSRIQSGKFALSIEKMDILAELGDALLIYAERARHSGIEIIYDEPDMLPFINGDKNRLRQVFINIIDNAVKYSESGGTITVIAALSADGRIRIVISDTGCGISEKDLPKIKTKFYKANTTKRGSGVGLAVANEIVTQHGGTLEVSSEPGKGTTVSILLPV